MRKRMPACGLSDIHNAHLWLRICESRLAAAQGSELRPCTEAVSNAIEILRAAIQGGGGSIPH